MTQVVTIARATIVRAEFGPGWRWSAEAGPAAETVSCQAAHADIVLVGRFAVQMDDGAETEPGPDAHVVGPGHLPKLVPA